MDFGIQCSVSTYLLGTEIREQSVSKQNFSKEQKFSIVIQVTEYKQHTNTHNRSHHTPAILCMTIQNKRMR